MGCLPNFKPAAWITGDYLCVSNDVVNRTNREEENRRQNERYASSRITPIRHINKKSRDLERLCWWSLT